MKNEDLYNSLLRKLLPVLLGMICLNGMAQAAPFENLLMPGEVIEGHKKYEQDCKNCHVSFEKKGQSRLCLDCHDKIRNDIDIHQGYHGKHKTIRKQQCFSCHTDHQGRNADIVKLHASTFDHQITDFPLRGAHQNTRCPACHKPGEKYREAPQQCHVCHRNGSPHKAVKLGKLSKRCDSCHSDENWLGVRFDHRTTEFTLTGAHRQANCVGCHPNDQFFKSPTNCFACHRLDDVHQGGNGKNCKKCHSTRSWESLSFNHDKDTDFPLRGRHTKLNCQSCHKQDPYKVEIESTCISCHRHDDEHRGRYGTKCDSCHAERRWSDTRFDHDRKTEFPLKGKHADVMCTACHKGNIYQEKLKTDCYACHRLDDAHRGQEGRECARCHDESGWRTKVRFDHDITRFPLIGLHSIAPCEACHLSPTYKNASIECRSCHEKDDSHKQKLGENCGQCHSPNGWSIWRFDHDTQTRFKLDGAHQGVHCHSCHQQAVVKINSTPRTCMACHRSDDPHRRQFGPRCERCHTTDSFKEIKLR